MGGREVKGRGNMKKEGEMVMKVGGERRGGGGGGGDSEGEVEGEESKDRRENKNIHV